MNADHHNKSIIEPKLPDSVQDITMDLDSVTTRKRRRIPILPSELGSIGDWAQVMRQIRDFFETHQQCYREEVSELKRCMDLECKAYHTRENTLEDYIKLLERQVDAAIKSDDDYRKEWVELQESLTKTRMQLEKSDRVLEVIQIFLSVAVPDYQPNFVHLLEDVTQARDLIEQRLQATN